MAITNGYCTLAELKTRLGVTDVVDDSVLEAVIEATSRLIDDFCGRRFYTTASDETRYYTAYRVREILCDDDILSITTLQTDHEGDRVYENTWQATDYDLEPYNAPLDGQPYTKISITPYGSYQFPVDIPKGVKIVGKFGYSATAPKPVQEACLIQASRLFRRKDAPFGITGVAEFGVQMAIARLDPDVKILLSPYRRFVVG